MRSESPGTRFWEYRQLYVSTFEMWPHGYPTPLSEHGKDRDPGRETYRNRV